MSGRRGQGRAGSGAGRGRWRRAARVLLLLLALSQGGCWDRRELEEMAFVLALGLDQDPEGGGLRMTAMVAIPNKMAGGGQDGGGEEDTVLVTTARAATVPEGLNLMDTYLDRRISLEHTKVMVLGRSLAEEEGLWPLMDFLGRFRSVRRTVPVMVAETTGEEVLAEIQPVLERDPHRYLEFLPFTTRDTGLSPQGAHLHELLTFTENPGIEPVSHWVALRKQPGGMNTEGAGKEGARPDGGGKQGGGEGNEGSEDGGSAGGGPGQGSPPLPGPAEPRGWEPGALPRRGGPNLEMVGAAVFRDGRMVGTMSGEEVRSLNLLRGRFRRAFLSVPDPLAPGQQVALEIRAGQAPRYRVSLAGGRPAISGRVPVEVEVQGIPSGVDYSRPEHQGALARAVQAELEAGIRKLIRRAQEEWQSDVIGLGLRVAPLFPTYDRWGAYGWDQRFPEAAIDIRVDVNLRRFGMQLQPPNPGR
ncbi:MAG: Ger(x)C family spore germination protein [Firmicutes bacterium]|nr:Ger(x)C family spore germination protein [Bacillota bacterium]